MVKPAISIKTSSKGSIDSIRKLRDSIIELKREFSKVYYQQVAERLRSAEVQNFYVNRVLFVLNELQSEFWGGASSIILEQDKTQLTAELWETHVRAEVSKNFNQIASSIAGGETTELFFFVLSDEFIGLDKDDNSSEPIAWLKHFFIGHLEGNLIWVNPKIYEAIKHKPAGKLGRFGIGHLWHLAEGEEEKIDSALEAAGISERVSDLRHPQSNKPARSDLIEHLRSDKEFLSQVIMPAKDKAIEMLAAKSEKSKK